VSRNATRIGAVLTILERSYIEAPLIANDNVLDDPIIRLGLRSKLLTDHSNDTGTVFLEELGLCRGRARVDLVVVNGHMHGYEIKSDCDSLSRLKVQAEMYARVFDQMTLVVGERLFGRGSNIVPPWWGVLLVKRSGSRLQFKVMRLAKKNPRIDPRSLVELLWLDDALRLLEERVTIRGIRGKPRRIVWDRICDHFALDEISAAVRIQLKTRAANQGFA
jgi:hypothetical protein